MSDIVKIDFSKEQIELIRSQIAPKATNDELKLFLYQCKRTGLDPMARQIYAIHRKQNGAEKMTVQTSIDGFRVIAERSGTYAGQSEPEFIEENGRLKCAKVRVFRFSPVGVRYEAAVGVAYWDEYVQAYNGQPSGLWAKMPHTMLSKVAEAIALRKAYPQDLSGLYTGEEMNQADVVDEQISMVDDSQKDYLIKLLENSSYDDEKRAALEKRIEAIKTQEQFSNALNNLLAHQLDPITEGAKNGAFNSTTDITKHIRKLS